MGLSQDLARPCNDVSWSWEARLLRTSSFFLLFAPALLLFSSFFVVFRGFGLGFSRHRVRHTAPHRWFVAGVTIVFIGCLDHFVSVMTAFFIVRTFLRGYSLARGRRDYLSFSFILFVFYLTSLSFFLFFFVILSLRSLTLQYIVLLLSCLFSTSLFDFGIHFITFRVEFYFCFVFKQLRI